MTKTMGLYSLRDTNRSVRLAAVLFMLVLGCAYVFAFLMVKEFAGLTPEKVSATYAPAGSVDEAALPATSVSQTQPIDLSQLQEERHVVDTRLLIQDSHIHILMFALVAALQTLIILGLEWPAGWRDTVIVAAFASGGLDFFGQWLMKAGIGGFAWLTLVAGWTMVAVYLVTLAGTLRASFRLSNRSSNQEESR